MNSILGVATLAMVLGGFLIWECASWVGARAELAKQQARKLRLENDQLEAMRGAQTSSRTQARF
ncbi:MULTISPECIES: hypothetical protein [unclassified Luteibacter]|uniref:hypothetical protein n=1 Tax=Luteibacter sp. PvP019 TaxID=3156436 RepID=UPI00339B6820